MAHTLRRLSDGLNLVAEYAVAALMVVMVVVVAAQVFSRHVAFHSLSWSEELSRYVLIWVTFLGASAGVKRKAHFGVQAITYFLPPRLRPTLTALTYLLAAAVFLVMVYFGWQNAQVVSRQVSPAMQLPMHYVYISIPVSGLVMLIHVLEQMSDAIGRGWTLERDEQVPAKAGSTAE